MNYSRALDLLINTLQFEGVAVEMLSDDMPIDCCAQIDYPVMEHGLAKPASIKIRGNSAENMLMSLAHEMGHWLHWKFLALNYVMNRLSGKLETQVYTIPFDPSKALEAMSTGQREYMATMLGFIELMKIGMAPENITPRKWLDFNQSSLAVTMSIEEFLERQRRAVSGFGLLNVMQVRPAVDLLALLSLKK